MSTLGVFPEKLLLPYDASAAGIGDYKIVKTLCPGGKERMRRLMEMVKNHRIDLSPTVSHSFHLDDIVEAYYFFGERRDGVMKVGVTPQ